MRTGQTADDPGNFGELIRSHIVELDFVQPVKDDEDRGAVCHFAQCMAKSFIEWGIGSCRIRYPSNSGDPFEQALQEL